MAKKKTVKETRNLEQEVQEQKLERSLLKKVKKGEHRAFEQIVEMYRERLYFSVYNLLGNEEESRDITQEAFVRMYRKFDDFDMSRPLYPWLHRIARNLALDYLKRHGTQRKVSLDGIVENRNRNFDSNEGMFQRTKGVRDQIHQEQMSHHLRDALEQLKPEFRDIIMMKHLQSMSYDEIAETLDIPNGTVMSRLFHARKALAKLMEKHRV